MSNVSETVGSVTTEIDESGVRVTDSSYDESTVTRYARMISDEISEFANERPVATTAVAAVGAVAIGYGVYKLASKLMS